MVTSFSLPKVLWHLKILLPNGPSSEEKGFITVDITYHKVNAVTYVAYRMHRFAVNSWFNFRSSCILNGYERDDRKTALYFITRKVLAAKMSFGMSNVPAIF